MFFLTCDTAFDVNANLFVHKQQNMNELQELFFELPIEEFIFADPFVVSGMLSSSDEAFVTKLQAQFFELYFHSDFQRAKDSLDMKIKILNFRVLQQQLAPAPQEVSTRPYNHPIQQNTQQFIPQHQSQFTDNYITDQPQQQLNQLNDFIPQANQSQFPNQYADPYNQHNQFVDHSYQQPQNPHFDQQYQHPNGYQDPQGPQSAFPQLQQAPNQQHAHYMQVPNPQAPDQEDKKSFFARLLT